VVLAELVEGEALDSMQAVAHDVTSELGLVTEEDAVPLGHDTALRLGAWQLMVEGVGQSIAGSAADNAAGLRGIEGPVLALVLAVVKGVLNRIVMNVVTMERPGLAGVVEEDRYHAVMRQLVSLLREVSVGVGEGVVRLGYQFEAPSLGGEVVLVAGSAHEMESGSVVVTEAVVEVVPAEQ
jgi:hypothetical protein